jgi:hypothetical protein
MKPDQELQELLANLNSLIGHDLAASSAARNQRPLTADWYKFMVIESADESVRDEMSPSEAAIYELLRQLEAQGWDGVTGLVEPANGLLQAIKKAKH